MNVEIGAEAAQFPEKEYTWMKELRDNTSRVGGLPTLPCLHHSTFQPSQRGFQRIRVCGGEITGDNVYRYQCVCPAALRHEREISNAAR
jgi:hypothetical protein